MSKTEDASSSMYINNNNNKSDLVLNTNELLKLKDLNNNYNIGNSSGSGNSSIGIGGGIINGKKQNEQIVYDDLYDFADMAFDENLEITRPIVLTTGIHGNDEDTDEDINLDYEYGFDYEKIIKDRLRAANEAFFNDSTPLIKNKTRISFDNTVSAIAEQSVAATGGTAGGTALAVNNTSETPKVRIKKKLVIMDEDSVAEIKEEEKVQQQQQQQQQQTEEINNKDEDEEIEDTTIKIVKIPLNDTIVKEDPNKFHNKLKSIVAKYDIEQPELIKQHLESHNGGGGGNGNNGDGDKEDIIFTKFKPLKHNNSNYDSVTDDEDDDEDNNDDEEEDDSSQYVDLQNSLNKADQILSKNRSNVNNKIGSDKNLNSSAPASTTPSPTLKNNNNKNEINDEVIEDSLPQKQQQQKENVESVADEVHFESNLNNSKPVAESIIESSSSQISTTTNNNNNNANSGNKVLIEREGQFLYVDSNEYLAQSKAKAITDKSINKRRTTTTNTNANSNNKSDNNNNVYTIAFNNNNNTNGSGSDSVFKSSNKQQKISLSLNLNLNNTRNAHSADVGGQRRSRELSKTRVESNKTPDYGENYKSPYALSPRRVMSSNVTQKQTEQQEQQQQYENYIKKEKNLSNELSFKAWLEKKDKQKKEDLLKREKEKNEKANSTTQSSVEENIITFEQWLNKKRTQSSKEKDYQKQIKELMLSDEKPRPTKEETRAAFKEWLKRKTLEKQDVKVHEKIERRKWQARYRRSRKYQRLTQAIELAQAYGYTSYYYTSGFTL